MSTVTKHILLPSTPTLAVIGLYFTPLTVIDCVTRGLLALAVVFISFAFGIVSGIRGLRDRHSKIPGSGWWITSMCILALPVFLVLGPLG